MSNKLYIAMTSRLLFPHRFRLIGWIIFVPSALLGLFILYSKVALPWLKINPDHVYESLNGLLGSKNLALADEVAMIGVLIGLLMVAFSREPVEDEMSSQLRLEALQWSVYTNYLVLAVAILTVYGGEFFSVLIYNMFTLLLVFIARYQWLLWRNTITLSA